MDVSRTRRGQSTAVFHNGQGNANLSERSDRSVAVVLASMDRDEPAEDGVSL